MNESDEAPMVDEPEEEEEERLTSWFIYSMIMATLLLSGFIYLLILV